MANVRALKFIDPSSRMDETALICAVGYIHSTPVKCFVLLIGTL